MKHEKISKTVFESLKMFFTLFYSKLPSVNFPIYQEKIYQGEGQVNIIDNLLCALNKSISESISS